MYARWVILSLCKESAFSRKFMTQVNVERKITHTQWLLVDDVVVIIILPWDRPLLLYVFRRPLCGIGPLKWASLFRNRAMRLLPYVELLHAYKYFAWISFLRIIAPLLISGKPKCLFWFVFHRHNLASNQSSYLASRSIRNQLYTRLNHGSIRCIVNC